MSCCNSESFGNSDGMCCQPMKQCPPRCPVKLCYPKICCPPPCCPDPCIRLSPKCFCPPPCCPPPCCVKKALVVSPPICPPRCCPPAPCCDPDPCACPCLTSGMCPTFCEQYPPQIIRPIRNNCCPPPPKLPYKIECAYPCCNPPPPCCINICMKKAYCPPDPCLRPVPICMPKCQPDPCCCQKPLVMSVRCPMSQGPMDSKNGGCGDGGDGGCLDIKFGCSSS